MPVTQAPAASITPRRPMRRPANDAEPFDGHGAGDWEDRWADRRDAAQAAPVLRMAELLRRLVASLPTERPG